MSTRNNGDHTTGRLPFTPPADASWDDRARTVLHAVADGDATWRTCLPAKAVAAALGVSLGQAYRRMDATEAFLRFWMSTHPAQATAWLSRLAAESAGLLASS